MKKHKNYLLILPCFIFICSWATSFAADQTEIANSGISYSVIAPIPMVWGTEEVPTRLVPAPDAFLLIDSVFIDDDYDNPIWTVTGLEKSLSFFNRQGIHPVFPERKTNGSRAPESSRAPPYL